MKGSGRRIIPVAIVGLTSVLFAPLLAGRYVFERDVYHIWYGQTEAFARSIAAYRLPLWDPTVSFGEPLLALPAQTLYPFTWLSALIPAPEYYSAAILAHHVWGGVGAWLLFRRLGVSCGGAVVGAGVFMTSGPWLSVVNMLNLFTGASWMPWMVLCAERTAASLRARDAVLWGSAVAACLLTCSEPVFMAGAFAGGWFGFRSLGGDRLRRRLALATLALALALALSIGQWLPLVALIADTERAALPVAERTYWSMQALHLIQFAVPLFGDDIPFLPTAALDDFRFPLFASVFFGPGALLLGIVGAFRSGRSGAVLGVALAVCVFLALGHNAPGAVAVADALPFTASLRFPVKWMLLGSLLIAHLAAIGWDRVESARPLVAISATLLSAANGAFWGVARVVLADLASIERDSFFGWTGLGVSTALLLAPWGALALRGRPSFAFVLALATVAPSAIVNRSINTYGPRTLFDEVPPLVTAFRRDGGTRHHFRAFDPATPRIVDLRPAVPNATEPLVVWKALSDRQALGPSVARAYGIRGSYEPDSRSAQTRHVRRLREIFERSSGTPAHLRLLRAAGVSHVSTLDAAGTGDWTLVGGHRTYLGRPVYLYRVPAPLPPCFVADGVRSVADVDAAHALAQGDFDIERIVVASTLEARAPGAERPEGSCDPTPSDPNSVRARVSSSGGVVVFLEAWAPGWEASVDGRPAVVHRVNAVFRGVEVPPGAHDVRLEYRPRLTLMSVASNALVAAIVAAWLIRG